MNLWELGIGKWRPVYSLGLLYCRYSPFDIFKEFLRHGVIGHTPRYVYFTNKDGITFHLDMMEYVQKGIFCFHYFEPLDVAAFRRFLKPGGVVFDVGANVGQYSLLASRLVGRTGRVYAFEPSPSVLPRLKENIALNAAENIHLAPKAVAASSGRMPFYPAREESNQGVGSLLPAEGIRADEGSEVEVVSLDDFCEANDIGHVDLLKIDVEGFDLDVLKGAERLLQRNPDLVVMAEVEPLNLAQRQVTATDYFRFMEAHGFQPWYAAKWGRLKPLKGERPPFPNVFFLRSRKR